MSFRPLTEYGSPVAVTAPLTIGVTPPDETPDPGIASEFGSAWRTENMIGSWLNNRGPDWRDRERKEDGFNIVDWAVAKNNPLYLEKINSAYDIHNREAAEVWAMQIDREEKDKQNLAAGGLSSFLAVGAMSIADPTILAPGGTIYRGVKGGYAVAKSAVSVGAMAAAGTGIQELALQATQEGRTAGESAINIGGSAILGGLLGGFVAGISRPRYEAAAEALAQTTRETIRVTKKAELERLRARAGEQLGRLQLERDEIAARLKPLDNRTVLPRSDDLLEAGYNKMPNLRNDQGLHPDFDLAKGKTVLPEFYPRIKAAIDDLSDSLGLKVKPTVWIGDAGGRAYATRQGGHIVLPADYDEERMLHVGLHEFGHQAQFQLLDYADINVQRGIQEEFQQFLFDYHGEQLTYEQAWPLTSRPWGKGVMEQSNQDYTRRFEEWFAENVSRWITTNAVPTSKVEQFFKGIADLWRSIYEKIVGRLPVNEEVAKFLQTNWRDLPSRPNPDAATGADRARLARVQEDIDFVQARLDRYSAEIDELTPRELERQITEQIGGGGTKPGAAGAAPVDWFSLDDLTVKGMLARGIGRLSAAMRLNVITRVLNSPSAYHRNVMLRLIENRVYLKMNQRGDSVGEAAETVVKHATEGLAVEFARVHARSFKAFIKAGGQMTRNEFNLAVMRVARGYGDEYQGIAEIQRSAAEFRKVDDWLGQQMEDMGFFNDMVRRRTSHVYRIWDAAKVNAAEFRFKDIATAYIREGVEKEVRALTVKKARKEAKIQAELNEIEMADLANQLDDVMIARREELLKKLEDIQDKFDERVNRGLDADNNYEGYISIIVDNIFNKITGRGDGAPYDPHFPLARNGPLRARTFDIPDQLVEEFIENDAELVMRTAARKASADIELARLNESMGGDRADPTLKYQFQKLTEDYAQMRRAVESRAEWSAEKRARESARLRKRERADRKDLEFARDMLRGTHMARENATGGARILQGVSQFNYMRMLGGQSIANLTDVMRPLVTYGLRTYMQDGLVPLATNMKGIKMSKADWELCGIGAEYWNNTRMGALADLSDPHSARSPVEAFLQNASGKFSKLTGITHLTDYMKYHTAMMTQAIIHRTVNGKGSKRENEWLGMIGINADNAERIRRQLDAHGIDHGRMRIANLEDWDDEVAKRVYIAAMTKEADSVITTPGIGDLPIAARHPYLRWLFAIRSFTLASNQAVLMRGLQEGPTKLLGNLVTMTAIGIGVYYTRLVSQGRLEEASDSPGYLIAEGFSNSGVWSVFTDINDVVEQGLGIGAHSLMEEVAPGTKETSVLNKFGNKKLTATVMGPTGDMLDRFQLVARQLAKGDLTESGINSLYKLIPFLGIPYLAIPINWGVMPGLRESVDE